jgi:hypothetical protein
VEHVLEPKKIILKKFGIKGFSGTAQHWLRPNPSSTLMTLDGQQNLNILNYTRINVFLKFQLCGLKTLQTFFKFWAFFFEFTL